MGTKQETIQNSIEIPQAESDNIPPEERIALETLARFNTLREQAGFAPVPHSCEAKVVPSVAAERMSTRQSMSSQPPRK